MADSKLKEFPASNRFLNYLEKTTVNFLNSRAESDASKDMVGINKILGISAIILFIVNFASISLGIPPNLYLLSIFLINSSLYSGFEWFLNIERETIRLVKFIVFLILSHWIFYLFEVIGNLDPGVVDLLKEQMSFFGFSQTSTNVQFLVEYSLLSLLSFSMILGMWIIMSIIPSISLLWLIKVLNRTSFILVNIERQVIQLFLVAVNILAPVWFFFLA